MSTETDIRRRWKDTQWWAFREEIEVEVGENAEESEETPLVVVNGPEGDLITIGGDLEPAEVAFYRQAAAAPQDIHRLLAIIDTMRQEIAELRAGSPPEEVMRGHFYITLTEEDMRRVELLYQTAQLTYEQRDAKEQGIPPEDYAELDEVMDEFVSGVIDLAWDMRDENAPTSGPMVKSA